MIACYYFYSVTGAIALLLNLINSSSDAINKVAFAHLCCLFAPNIFGFYSLCTIYLVFILCAHPVYGESHIQCQLRGCILFTTNCTDRTLFLWRLHLVLQPLRWCCVDCVIHHEWDVREEQHHTYMWRERAIIEGTWHVNSIVACCHSTKLCAYAARDFLSQHWHDLHIMGTAPFFAIKNPEWQVHKVSHCAASNNRDHLRRSLCYCLIMPHIQMYGCCSSCTSRSWWIADSTQRQPRGWNNTLGLVHGLCHMTWH